MGMVLIITAIIIVIAMSSSSSNKKGADSGIQKTTRGYFIGINNIKMENPLAQKVFDWYKKVMITDKKTFYEVLRNIDLRREWHKIQEIEKSLPDNDDMTYIDAMSMEFGNSGSKTTYNPDGFILNPREECYFHAKSIELKTMQRICVNVSSAGFKFNNGGFRTGNMTYYPKNVEGLKHYDDGEILVTNQRILFKGNSHTMTIALGNIIGIENFENDGVIMFLSNRTTPIVIKFLANNQFFYNKEHNVAFFHNDLNYFYWAMENVFYKRLVPQDVQDMRKDADEVNFNLARMAMIREGLESEEKVA